MDVLTDEELIAAGKRLYGRALESEDNSMAFKGPPVANTQWDQEIPESVSNPYWEILRRFPTDEGSWPWGDGKPTIHGFWFGGDKEVLDEIHRLGLWREGLVRRYSWSIPSPGDIEWIDKVTDGRGVVEIGAGGGYWAWQMRQYGIDVIAYDRHKPSPNNIFAKSHLWTAVERGGTPRAALHPDRALFLCWPTYADGWANRALRAYQGDTVIYAGEDGGGCTADDAFHTRLWNEWELEEYSPHHFTYWGIHCRLGVWRRK